MFYTEKWEGVVHEITCVMPSACNTTSLLVKWLYSNRQYVLEPIFDPTPFPAFQRFTLKSGRAWYTKLRNQRHKYTEGTQGLYRQKVYCMWVGHHRSSVVFVFASAAVRGLGTRLASYHRKISQDNLTSNFLGNWDSPRDQTSWPFPTMRMLVIPSCLWWVQSVDKPYNLSTLGTHPHMPVVPWPASVVTAAM